MNIYIEDQVINNSSHKNNKEIWDKIEEIIEESEKLFYSLKIDKHEAFENFEHFFITTVKNSSEVEINTVTYKEFTYDVLMTARDYLIGTPKKIKDLANIFYITPNEESWNQINDLLEGVNWITNTAATINETPKLKEMIDSQEYWLLFLEENAELIKHLSYFEIVLENMDYIMIGDILLYEVNPRFKKMSEILSTLLSEE